VIVALTGDWHLDGTKKQYRAVKRDVEAMPDTLILMGDMIDSGISGGMNWKQENPTVQIKQFMDIIKDKIILGYVLGNHEFRIMRVAGLNIYQTLLGDEKQSYKIDKRLIEIEHGSRAPQDQAKQVEDLANIHRNASLCALGHTHGLMIDRNAHRQWVVRTGHLQLYPDYGRRKIMPCKARGYIRYDTLTNKVYIEVLPEK
jgi:predicted phosphodiesterase